MGGNWVTNDDFGYIGNIFKERTKAKLTTALNQYVDYLLEHMLVERTEDATHHRYFSTKAKGGTWVASAPGEYPAVRSGDLVEALADPNNWKVEWENQQTAIAFIKLPENISAYAMDILEAEMRPWANRALIETQTALEDTLGPKLTADIEESLLRIKPQRRN